MQVYSNSQDLFAYSPTEPKEPPHFYPTPRKKCTVVTNDQQNVDESIEYWKARALADEDLSHCSSDILPLLVNELQEHLNLKLSLGLYHESEVAKKALARAKHENDTRKKDNAQHSLQRDYKERLNLARQDLKQFEDKSRQIEMRLDETYEKQKQELLEQQALDYQQLDDEWKSEARRRRYNRSSQQLRNLRVQIILLQNQYRFEEMKELEKRANMIEETETELNARLMESDYSQALKNLQTRHREALRILYRTYKNKKMEFISSRNSDLAVLKNKVKKLEIMVQDTSDPQKVWNHYHRFDTLKARSPKKRSSVPSKRKINVQEFNTLNLPLLEETKSARLIRITTRNYNSSKISFSDDED